MTNGTDGGCGEPRWIAEVVVVPKAGVNDPEGEAILGGLRSLGYAGVCRVRAGRFFTIELTASDAAAARSLVTRMADQLLANPVIQSFCIQAVEPAARVGREV